MHKSVAEKFIHLLVDRVSTLKAGLPWEEDVSITPLPQNDKPAYLEELIADAVAKGAQVMNADRGGGELAGSLMRPAIVYPVTSNMRLWKEEQFGPIIPVAIYEEDKDLYEYYKETSFGQQAAIFTSNASKCAPILDVLALAVGRININSQCSRSPDTLPFSGRRSSALGIFAYT
jgi:glyceraldehyde-3-phosphate dehydrogenase (NADP+)